MPPHALAYDDGAFRCVCPGGMNGVNDCEHKNRVEGSVAFVPSVFGMTMASVAVKLLRRPAAAEELRATEAPRRETLRPCAQLTSLQSLALGVASHARHAGAAARLGRTRSPPICDTVAGTDEAARRRRGHRLDPRRGRVGSDRRRRRIARCGTTTRARFDTVMPPLVTPAPPTPDRSRRAATTPAIRASRTRRSGMRWALPVQYPSMVAELAGAPIDTVFVRDGSGWRALAGLDDLLLARVRALDPACADLVVRAAAREPVQRGGVGTSPIPRCAIDRERFSRTRAQLATNACGNRSSHDRSSARRFRSVTIKQATPEGGADVDPAAAVRGQEGRHVLAARRVHADVLAEAPARLRQGAAAAQGQGRRHRRVPVGQRRVGDEGVGGAARRARQDRRCSPTAGAVHQGARHRARARQGAMGVRARARRDRVRERRREVGRHGGARQVRGLERRGLHARSSASGVRRCSIAC